MLLTLSRTLLTRWPTLTQRNLSTKIHHAVENSKQKLYYRQPLFYRYFQHFIEENNFQHLVSKEAAFNYRQALEEFNEIYEIVTNSSQNEDRDFVDLAAAEAEALTTRLLALQDEIIANNIIQDDSDVGECTFEIRAGVGGKEAVLFAEELFQLYMKLFPQIGWSLRTNKDDFDQVNLEDNTSLASETVEVLGTGCYRLLRHEAGIHRVQRIPKTEKYGRLHTSTVSISVIPIRANLITIKDSDLKFEVKNSSGAGGQNVNRNLTCVRVTHVPTGHVAESQETRYQYTNKDIAIRKLKAFLNQLEYDRREKEARQQKRVQVGIAARSDKIRTYNFPQNRITDHRLASEAGEVGSWHNIEGWMAGQESDKLILAMERLEALRHRELAHQMRSVFETKFVNTLGR